MTKNTLISPTSAATVCTKSVKANITTKLDYVKHCAILKIEYDMNKGEFQFNLNFSQNPKKSIGI